AQADVVAEDCDGAAHHLDAVAHVARDDVALGHRGAADGGIAAALYLHAVKVVGNGEGPKGVQADEVTCHLRPGGVGGGDAGAVAGDDVVQHLAVGAAVDLDAVFTVARGQAAGVVGADVVALDDRAGRRVEEVDADADVARDDVPRRRADAAHGNGYAAAAGGV